MKQQFRVLYRQFLFRMVDLELLSLQGDMNKLLGQLAALLVFLSIVFSVPALLGRAPGPPLEQLIRTLSFEHFLIATTMLVIGLFAVLSWDSTFPDRRDVLVLAPLPIRARTMFLAKVAAVATALSLTVVTLHVFAGFIWPIVLNQPKEAQSAPSLTFDRAMGPVDAAGLEGVLNRDFAAALAPGTGVAIGVWEHGVRRVFARGTARPNSIFAIGSITKTFTSLALAQMVQEGKANLDEPVRELLPAGTVSKPRGIDITLRHLATHRSGLSRLPDNLHPADIANYHTADLYAYIEDQGVERPSRTSFYYSDVGMALLGVALANRAGTTYPNLIQDEVAGPLGLKDTAVLLTPEQARRLIQGHDRRHRSVPALDLDAMAGSDGIRSTAGDMISYLEANLHPEKFSSSGLSKALAESHKMQAEVPPSTGIALGWIYNMDTGVYWHNGAIGGYSSYVFFHPKADYAAVVLLNSGPDVVSFADLLGEHIRQRLAGEPAVSLNTVELPASGGALGLLRLFAVYWITMFASGTFIFCCVLGTQGLAAQLLPRRRFLRVSSFLQMAAFCLFVSVYFLQPSVSPQALSEAQSQGLPAWSPSYWFLGLFQQLNGSPVLAVLARRAWIALAVAVSVTALAYVLSYFRTLRKIVEEPDIVASSGGLHWLPRFGNSLQTAVVQFSIRTLLRSRQHRVILVFYLGVGFALSIFFLRNPGPRNQIQDQSDIPWLISTVTMMCICVVGMRVVFSLPLAPRSNWVFRVTQVRATPEYLVAVRRPLFVMAVAPVLIISAVALLSIWPWRLAVTHLVVLGLLGAMMAYLCLHGFQKIPFTCFYLPGKSYIHMAFLTALGIMVLILRGVIFERSALHDPVAYSQMLVVLIVAVAAARWRTVRAAGSEEAVVQFEDDVVPVIQGLGLHRDGVVPIANA